MPGFHVAITHRTLNEREEVALLSVPRLAIGTSIKGKSKDSLDIQAMAEVALLEKLGTEGGVAVTTFGDQGSRWLCRIAAGSRVELFDGLRSLPIASIESLPRSLAYISAERGNTIRQLTDAECADVELQVARLKWQP